MYSADLSKVNSLSQWTDHFPFPFGGASPNIFCFVILPSGQHISILTDRLGDLLKEGKFVEVYPKMKIKADISK